MKPFPMLYFPHGAGPMPLLGEPNHDSLVSFLKRFANQLPKPKAILIISAHWEAAVPTVLDVAKHHLLFDYYGFPAAAYDLVYQPPVASDISKKILTLLSDHHIDCKTDEERGLDHGAFVPLKIMYPDADIPCTQLSLVDSLEPDDHIRMGRALSALRNDGVLILGSGSSFHNLSLINGISSEDQNKSIAFDKWLTETCCDSALDPSERYDRMVNWNQAPHAVFSHPREEHLIPLHVCFGAAISESTNGSIAEQVFDELFMGVKVSAYCWDYSLS